MKHSGLLLFAMVTLSCNNTNRGTNEHLTEPTITSNSRQLSTPIAQPSRKSVPAKYTVLKKKEGLIDVLVSADCTKENCRWIIQQVLNQNDKNCSVDLWTNKSAYKKYSDFYDEEDKAYDQAIDGNDFRNKMAKKGKGIKERIVDVEDIRSKNVMASYGGGYLTFLNDDSQESFQ